jgi:hypothetical protein
MAFLFVSRSAPAPRRRPAAAPDVVSALPAARQPVAKPSAAPAPVPVEQSA